MNGHHYLCDDNNIENDNCEVCKIITRIYLKMLPPCTCGMTESIYYEHKERCRFASFAYSQWGWPDENSGA